jgi:hypothetical protein
MTNKKVELDLDIVDSLALVSLYDHRNYLVEALEGSVEFLHPDDQERNARLIGAFTEVIKYYGGK